MAKFSLLSIEEIRSLAAVATIAGKIAKGMNVASKTKSRMLEECAKPSQECGPNEIVADRPRSAPVKPDEPLDPIWYALNSRGEFFPKNPSIEVQFSEKVNSFSAP